LFEPRRDRVPTTGKGSDHHPIPRIELTNHRAGDMAQPTGHPVPLHRVPYRFGNDQPDPRAVRRVAGRVVTDTSRRMHDKVGLHRPHPLTDSGTEFR
jgi:hypothetical protein